METPRPWGYAISRAVLFLFGALLSVEARAKIELYGWHPSNWPMELSFMKDSPGLLAFFILFIVPIIFAIVLAAARHAPEDTDD